MQDSYHSKDLIRIFFLALCVSLETPTVTHGNELQVLEKQVRSLQANAPILGNLEQREKGALSQILLQQGELFNKQKAFLKAASSFRKAKAIYPDISAIDLHIGIAYADAQRLSLARRFLKSFDDQNTDPALKLQCEQKLYQVLVAMGEESSRISLWDQAINSYHEAMNYSNSTQLTLDLIDKIQTAYFRQGTFHYSQKHYLEASRNFLKALSKNTKENLRSKIERIAGHLFLNAGKHYEKMGQLSEAKPYYTAVIDYFHEDKVVLYAKQRLDSLGSQILEERADIPEWLRVD